MSKNILKKVLLFVMLIILLQIINPVFSLASSNRYIEVDGNVSFSEIQRMYEEPDEVPYVNKIIGAIVTLIQIGMFLIAISLIIYTIYKNVSLKSKIKKMEKEEVTEDDKGKTLQEIKDEYDIIRRRTIVVVIFIIVIAFIYNILEIVNDFAKPIIYIYPEEDGTEVIVSLENPDILTCTYPKYNEGWHVTADKDGTLTDESGRKYYALYWEGDNTGKETFEDGFVVKGEDTAEFLEEKLEILGLNEKEAEEFIVYWLPKLEKNRYNLIRFKDTEEMNEEVKLNISPEPETLIRVMMEYKPLLIKKNVKEQELTKVERKGYTVVEWGATEY